MEPWINADVPDRPDPADIEDDTERLITAWEAEEEDQEDDD